ncbi:response regulator [Cytobacillus firmus]|uniref:AraC family transcriptional regulator n=1 Tax=Cytobacillus firmus DS1 TaxID=1307436 RepID=W7LL11_CYTFI|nr:response regulator [Cytobacillus firmus]EWG12799.1 AraC family transcriptional regulator [Cytobacillus firmus DS1]
MTKLLIADDEQIEREGLEVILQKAFPDVEISQAKNGKMAVQLAKELYPDLILMDIQMPGMNGLEAIKLISEDDPDIKFIMITAFDTFDYARQAIKLGVKDYLLKPSKITEIEATVGKVLEEIEEERKFRALTKLQKDALQRALPVIETDVVTQLLFDHVHEVHLDMLVEMLEIPSTDEQFVMSILLPEGHEHLYTPVKEKVRQAGSAWVGALYGRQLPIIVFREKQQSFRSQAISIAGEILSLPKKASSEGWFIGIGNACGSLQTIRQSYQESLIATMDSTLPVKYRFYSDVPALSAGEDLQLTKEREKQFFDQVRLGKWDQVSLSVMEMIQRCEREREGVVQAQQRVLQMLWIASRVMSEIGVEAPAPFFAYQTRDFRQLRTGTEQLLKSMKKSYLEHYDRLEADTIQQLKYYITEHSHEDISLEALGRKVGLSPIYISKMFKEKLGVNYIDFLTECRIEKAKKLMADSGKSLKEITFEVGYHEPNYFSKVFKKMCGQSPTEFRKALLGK